ncbi:TetR/AcrR family transcriptional regulator [Caldifermentibacillus hisashii]|uniref:TetR/AcrR family transcriptional regulator n=1 Tax=Caldifermentibacillus hisashii TaxID=996558 RepID=UPI0034D5947B
MHERKKQVIKMAHQLFIDKGFHATSINDIIEYSGISKGTFYNYFSSKNELIIELFKTNYKQLEKDRNDLLIGQDPANFEIFIKQVELQIYMNQKNKLISIFEEIIVSRDEELMRFFKRGQLRILKWYYNRFIDLFGEDKKPYLLDCAIMFIGILHNNLKYYAMAYEGRDELRIQDVIRYSLNRIIRVVDEVEKAEEGLFSPELLDQWLPESNINSMDDQQILYRTILSLKKPLVHRKEAANYIELLDFIYDELLNKEEQRQFLISLAIRSLKESKELFDQAQLEKLEKIVINFNKK